jgi:hypothetical protein
MLALRGWHSMVGTVLAPMAGGAAAGEPSLQGGGGVYQWIRSRPKPRRWGAGPCGSYSTKPTSPSRYAEVSIQQRDGHAGRPVPPSWDQEGIRKRAV